MASPASSSSMTRTRCARAIAPSPQAPGARHPHRAAPATRRSDIVRREKVSAMLLDTHLPGTSAIELVPALLELEPTLAILMLTAVQRRHHGGAVRAARGDGLPHRAAGPRPPHPRGQSRAAATAQGDGGHPDRALARAMKCTSGRRNCAGSRKRWSGCRSPRSRRWSTRWRRRMPTCGVIRRGWPTSRPGSPRNSACRMRTWR